MDMVKRLYSQGVKSRYIAKLVSEINRKLLNRVFTMIVPKKYHKSCCFIVMGSEGRGEQIVKTDQDNGLIVDDSLNVEIFKPYMEKIGDILIELGYPPCKGNIMVTNPFWRDNLNGYKNKISNWLNGSDEESYIHFATFFDAVSVLGNNKLLNEKGEFV